MEYSPTQEKFATAAKIQGFATRALVAFGVEGAGPEQLLRLGMNACLRHPEWAQAMIADYITVSLPDGQQNFDAAADEFVKCCPVEVLDVVR